MGIGSQPLPSQQASDQFVCGQQGSFAQLLGSMALRGILVSGALSLAGVPPKSLLRNTLFVVGGIEAFVLVWSYLHRDCK